jgi:transposase
MRRWACSDCEALHDRDVNAARNLLGVEAERRPLAEEVPVLWAGKTLSAAIQLCQHKLPMSQRLRSS